MASFGAGSHIELVELLHLIQMAIDFKEKMALDFDAEIFGYSLLEQLETLDQRLPQEVLSHVIDVLS